MSGLEAFESSPSVAAPVPSAWPSLLALCLTFVKIAFFCACARDDNQLVESGLSSNCGYNWVGKVMYRADEVVKHFEVFIPELPHLVKGKIVREFVRMVTCFIRGRLATTTSRQQVRGSIIRA